jgi:hypothetical protein
MKKVALLSLGLGVLACNSSKLVSDNFDTGVDAPTDGPGVVVDAGALDARGDASPAIDGGAVCPAGSLGPTMEGPPRRTLSWTFSPPAVDAGVPAGDAGAGDSAASPSRCVKSTVAAPVNDYSCRGGAQLSAGAAGPILTFDDGSKLTWDAGAPPAPPPYVQGAGGDRVWVSFLQMSHVICPVCGAYTYQWLEIRDTGASGTVRYYAQQGDHLASPLDLAGEMFGVPVAENAVCTIHATGCLLLDRTEYDHQVATTPAQTIPFATLTEISAPGGTYDVLWAATSEANVKYGNCTDTPGPTNDNGFVATRRMP